VRADPLPGCSSFLQEHLNKWRELNAAADFCRVAQELTNIIQTMPLLLHHKDQVSTTTSILPPNPPAMPDIETTVQHGHRC
jgi:hypothetical protein